MNAVIEKVDDFVRKYHDLDYVIDSRAMEIWYGSSESSIFDRKRTNLTDHLANAISMYDGSKDDNEQNRLVAASVCLIWINRAFACGVVKEGQGLARKLRETEERNVQLQKDLEKLSADYLNLKARLDQFSKFRLTSTEEEGNDEPPS